MKTGEWVNDAQFLELNFIFKEVHSYKCYRLYNLRHSYVKGYFADTSL